MTDGPSADADQQPSGSDLYKIAVDEYRWQAQFNWSRTQYFLAFNAAILAAAVAVSNGRPGALVFLLGAVAAALSALAVRTQHGYYRAARDHMTALADELGIPQEQRLQSTAKLAKRPGPRATVNQVVYLLFGSLFVADIVGASIVLLK